jgi:hypothetical protein
LFHTHTHPKLFFPTSSFFFFSINFFFLKGHFCCGVLSSSDTSGGHTVQCFGDSYGYYTPTATELANQGLLDYTPYSISGGCDFLCTLTTDGTLGIYYHSTNQLFGYDSTWPVSLSIDSNGLDTSGNTYVQAACGTFAAYAIDSSGSLAYYGRVFTSAVGPVVSGTDTNGLVATFTDYLQRDTSATFSLLSANSGFGHACGVNSGNGGECWGADYASQATDGNTIASIDITYVYPPLLSASSPTPQPTKQPIPAPTPQPTKQPIPAPTPQPTPRPTPQPQSANSPTRAPHVTTPSPTPQPTPRPTSQPQSANSPTSAPHVTTPSPTPQPTPRPTSQPSFRPSHHSTQTPSLQPTYYPTTEDTVSISVIMTMTATAAPTTDDKSTLINDIATQLSVEIFNIHEFEVVYTSSRRRALLVGTWDVTFKVVVSLASSGAATASVLTSSITTSLQDSTFQLTLMSDVTSITDIPSVTSSVTTYVPTSAPTTKKPAK